MLKLNNGKWYCTTHKVCLQICTNNTTGEQFLKCPCNKKFECKTIDSGLFNPDDYEYYLPNYNSSLVYDMKEQIDNEESDYFHSSDFDF